jgi:hypothetical protein
MFLIKISSSFKFLIDKAIAREIAKGRPSGTATMRITTEITAVSATLRSTSLRNTGYELRIKLKKTKVSLVTTIRPAANFANLLICSAAVSSLCSKNVFYSSTSKSFGYLLVAKRVLLPTQQIRAFPDPVMILVSENKNGSGLLLWLSGIGAPN